MLDGRHILAVHHDAGLNGATLLFQSILEGLAKCYGASISTWFPREGPLVTRAKALGPVQVGDSPPPGRLDTVRKRVAERVGYGTPRRACDLIFANSIASLGIVERMLARDASLEARPLVVYVHESAYLLHEGDFEATKRMLRRARLIFAVSSSVQRTLMEAIQPSATISIVSGFLVERDGTGQPNDLPLTVRAAISSGARIVGGMGNIAWYKGPDLFVMVARRIRELLPLQPLRFIWMGQGYWDVIHLLERDIERTGLSDVVLLPGETHDPLSFFNALSLFLLPSREDSWPLVMLEAASAGVPIICFQGSGGAEEFLATGGGIAVPYLDVEAMAQAAVRYLSEPDLVARAAGIARQRARAVTREAQVRKIASEIGQMLESLSPSHGQTGVDLRE